MRSASILVFALAVLAVPVTAAISVVVDEIRAERIAPSVDVDEDVIDDLLPRDGVATDLPEATNVLAERAEVEAQRPREGTPPAGGPKAPPA